MVEESFALLPFLLHDKMIVETCQRAFLALGREEGGVRSLGHLFTCCQVADIVVSTLEFLIKVVPQINVAPGQYAAIISVPCHPQITIPPT